MNKQDDIFFRHLHKLLAEEKRDFGITTIRAQERKRQEQKNSSSKSTKIKNNK